MRRKYKIWSDIAPNSLGGFPKNFVSALTCWNSVDFWLLQSKMKERPVCRVVSKTWRMTPRDDAAGLTNKHTSGAARCTGDSANDWNRTWLLDMTVAWTVQNRLAKNDESMWKVSYALLTLPTIHKLQPTRSHYHLYTATQENYKEKVWRSLAFIH